jgi:hypothetical protein
MSVLRRNGRTTPNAERLIIAGWRVSEGGPRSGVMAGYDQGIGATGYLAKFFDGADSFHGRSRKAGKRFLFPMFHCVCGIDGQQDCTSFRQCD